MPSCLVACERLGTNTRIEQVELGQYESGEALEVDFTFDAWLTPHQYTITAATQYLDGSSHDWLDDVITFDVLSPRIAAGVTDLRSQINFRRIASHEDAAGT